MRATGDRYRTLEDERFDVIVVGAGVGGLTAAALLATRGHKVLVVDQHYVPGGNMSAFRRPGYEFDVGLHYIGGCHESGLITRLLRGAGAGQVEFLPMDPDAFDTLVLPGRTFKVPRGLPAFRARLLEAFPAERRGIERYVDLMEQLLLLQGTLGRPLALLGALPRTLSLLRWLDRPYAAFLDTCTRDPELRAVLAGQHLDYALPPSRVTTFMGLLLPAHLIESGGYYPKGGAQAVADALASSVETRGGKVLLRTTAEEITVERGRVSGVLLANKHIGRRHVRAPHVISNADLKRTLLQLVGPRHLSQRTLARVESYEMAPALGSVYLGIERDLRAEKHPAVNFWVQDSLDLEQEYACAARGELAEHPSIIVSIASVKDPHHARLAPPGITNLQLMSVAPSQPEAWGVTRAELERGTYRDAPAYLAKKREYGDRLIRMAERVLPGITAQVAYSEVATPLTQARYTRSTGGTSYGIAATPAQALLARPDARTEIAGLYLCGASCFVGHGIAGAALSGLRAASCIEGLRLIREVMVEDRRAPNTRVEGAARAAFDRLRGALDSALG